MDPNSSWAASHLLSVRWKRSILPWVWGWAGLPFLPLIPRAARSISKPVAAPLKGAV